MSGPPGSGKSTTAQFMARNHGYVYYDVDCFGNFSNPFIDLFAKNATLAQETQIPLKVYKHFYIKNQSYLDCPINMTQHDSTQYKIIWHDTTCHNTTLKDTNLHMLIGL